LCCKRAASFDSNWTPLIREGRRREKERAKGGRMEGRKGGREERRKGGREEGRAKQG
jgi:hypothetical protein